MTEIVVKLPTLHADQVRAYRAYQKYPRFMLRAGRRWGKSAFDTTVTCDKVIKGGYVGLFFPDYKTSSEMFRDQLDVLQPIVTSSSKVDGVIRTRTGGRIDFWTLDNERAGRSRKYDLVIGDEFAFNKPGVMDVWERAIEPTLLDRNGRAIFSSNTNGRDPDNAFFKMWRWCQNCPADEPDREPREGWGEYHAPTSANPMLPERRQDESLEAYQERRPREHAEMMAKLRRDKIPIVYDQEHEALFCDFSGIAFFDLQRMFDDGQPVDYPPHCDYVFATIDTATKTGKENDGTAVTYWARTFKGFGPHQLVLLDWDIQQIEGALLDTWLPTVFKNLEHLAMTCRARGGSAGAWIEDKASGMVLLQQAARRGWPATPIDSKLTSLGKVERAINASPYVYQGLVKISRAAHDKVATYKGATRNHLEGQVLAFRVDDKDPTRQDDLLDSFTYSVAISLGTAEGF